MLLLVSLMTFAIFFLMGLARRTLEELAQQYAGHNPTPPAVHAVERKPGF